MSLATGLQDVTWPRQQRDLTPEFQLGPSRVPSEAHAWAKGNDNLKTAPLQAPYCQGQT